MEIVKTRARFSSFCYGCGEAVRVGQTICKTEYIHPVTNDVEIAWRHSGVYPKTLHAQLDLTIQ